MHTTLNDIGEQYLKEAKDLLSSGDSAGVELKLMGAIGKFNQALRIARNKGLGQFALIYENNLKESEYLLARYRSSNSNPDFRSTKLSSPTESISDNGSEKYVPESAPNSSFDDIAGFEKIKEQINDEVIDIIRDPKTAEEYGDTFGGGILLYGPPGTGKTHLIECIVGELNKHVSVSFFKVDSIKGGIVGETEKNITSLFESARKHEPSILYFDEVSEMFPDDPNSPSYHKSMIGEMQKQMSGFGTGSQKILFIGTTNYPWKIPKPLLRRFISKGLILVGPPNLESREKIIKSSFKNLPVSSDFDYNAAAIDTDGYVGSEIKSICDKAKTHARRECKIQNKKVLITNDIFSQSVKLVVKSSARPWFEQASSELSKKDYLKDIFKDVFDYHQTHYS